MAKRRSGNPVFKVYCEAVTPYGEAVNYPLWIEEQDEAKAKTKAEYFFRHVKCGWVLLKINKTEIVDI